MSIFYSIEGEFKTRNVQEAYDLYRKFNNESPGSLQIEIVDENENFVAFVVNGNAYMSGSRVNTLDNILTEFSQYVDKPYKIDTNYEGKSIDLWIGKDEEVKDEVSAYNLGVVLGLLTSLNESDKKKLDAYLNLSFLDS